MRSLTTKNGSERKGEGDPSLFFAVPQGTRLRRRTSNNNAGYGLFLSTAGKTELERNRAASPGGNVRLRKRIVAALILAAVFVFANASFAASSSSAQTEEPARIGLTLYLVDAQGKPMADAVVLLQRNFDAAEAYEGRTDGRGAVTIPRFPLSGFVLATRSEDNTVTGLVEVTLYPGTRTEIMNKPQLENGAVRSTDVQDTAFSRNVSGSGTVGFAQDELPLNAYEVQVRTGAEGLACLFQQETSNDLLLRGVGEGEAGEIAPEPTLPPGDEDRPQTTATQRPSSAASQSASASASQDMSTAAPEPTAAKTTQPEPTKTAEETEPTTTPLPTGTPTPVPAVTEPPASPAATPTPTAAPPSPTAAPTTLDDYVNIKLFLKDTSGTALSYYVAVLNSVAQATCNEDGEAYFTNVPTEGTNELVVRNTRGDQVGSCGLQFVEGSETALSSVNTGGVYTISYAKGSQDVYVEIVVDVQQNQQPDVVIEEASAAPLDPGTTPTPAPTETPSASAQAPTASAGSDEVIGTATRTGPSVSGYFSNEAGIAIPGATIRLVNEDTKNLSSSITNSDGAFGVGQLPPANYSLNAIDPQGRNLGTIKFTVARGKRTQVKTARDGKTYLTEGPNDSTVYMDLRELSNGTVDLMYASKSPLTAPAVLTSFSPMPSVTMRPQPSQAEDANLSIEEDVEDITTIQRPGQEEEADAGTIVFVVVLCAMGVAVAAILLVRHARIR